VVEFDLDDAHPGYRRDIPAILAPLVERYPGIKLRSVSLYRPEPGDTSMGQTTADGRIELNPFWFTKPPAELNSASRHHYVVEVDGAQIGWHGPMIWEPRQLLYHEAGHAAWYGLPKQLIERWAGDRWRAATRQPLTAPSGYGLLNPAEFFGELFALVHLGLATDEEVEDMEELLEQLR
jgi:hypothetical protein